MKQKVDFLLSQQVWVVLTDSVNKCLTYCLPLSAFSRIVILAVGYSEHLQNSVDLFTCYQLRLYIETLSQGNNRTSSYLWECKPYFLLSFTQVWTNYERCHLCPCFEVTAYEWLVVSNKIASQLDSKSRVAECLNSCHDLLLLLSWEGG